MNTIDSPLLGLSQRLPPSNMQAEQALLGALLANNRAYERVSEFLAPDHFADPIHGRIFQAIARRIEAGQLADAVTLKAEFEHSGVLEEVGGTAYLAQLLTAMVGIINAGEYGRAVHDAWLRRQLIDIGETVVNNAFGADAELDGAQQIEAAEHSLFQLATDGAVAGGFVTLERALIEAIHGAERAFKRAGHVSGLTTGLHDLDAKMGGLHPSDLVILAGRPGMGKTSLATKVAVSAAKALLAEARADDPNALSKATVAVFSLEMSAEQLATRLLSEEVAGLRRPDPSRRHQPAGLRQVRPCIARGRLAADRHRRHAGDHAVGAAHARAAIEADQGSGAGRGRPHPAHAPGGRHQAGQPRAGDRSALPGPEGDRQGTGGAGAGPVAAFARG